MPEYAHTFKVWTKSQPTDFELPPPDFGRVLTLPEINRLRRLHEVVGGLRGDPWSLTYLTASLEYYGVTKGGLRVAAVRHGEGPSQDDLDTDPSAFARLLDGAFGDVHVVDWKDVNRWERCGKRRRFPFNPLVEARFGGAAEAQAFEKQADFRLQEGCTLAARVPLSALEDRLSTCHS